jgi:hypothetical protein
VKIVLLPKVLARSALMLSALSSSILLTTNSALADRSSHEVYTQVAQADQWTNEVRGQLLVVAGAAGLGGYQMTHDPFIGSLGNGGYNDITLNVRDGVSYAIVGVCDSDCRDIDLELYDDNGNRIVADTGSNDTPGVRFTPRWSARFTIRVTMASCSNAPCRYGIGFFGS